MAKKNAGKTLQPTPQAVWERTKGVATQIIEDDHQHRAEKIATLKAARLAREAAAPPPPPPRPRRKPKPKLKNQQT